MKTIFNPDPLAPLPPVEYLPGEAEINARYMRSFSIHGSTCMAAYLARERRNREIAELMANHKGASR